MVLNTNASYPHGQTFVLRLHRDAAPQQGRLVGRLDHVASGQQLTFETAEELISCLARAAELAESAAAGES